MNGTERLITGLLRDWGDALTELQIDMPGRPEFDGGIMCPACKMIHGRCHEAVYPFMCLASLTGKDHYLTSAKRLFRWGANMLCSDGSLRNDAKSDWRGVTVFGAIALRDALYYHGDLLAGNEKAEWESRLAAMGKWLYENLRPGRTQAYLNYYAANACAMALLGGYFGSPEYLTLARELADFCFGHVTGNLLLYGEGHPLDAETKKGCRAIDVGGYNAEETLPALTRCAFALDDAEMIDSCRRIWSAHLEWMLPDGAWDDSVGSRAFKWTYWGSRTSDGCQDALFLLGKDDPVFAEAALRNTELLAKCTHGGLLYGGPDYRRHGENPCVHHTFCHAKALAGSIDNGLRDFGRVPLPAETPKDPGRRCNDLDVIRIRHGGWIADVCGYDYFPFPGAHASGGSVSLLWHKKTGPLIACGAVDFTVREICNQQFPSRGEDYRSPCPRLEILTGGRRYASAYDRSAFIIQKKLSDSVLVSARTVLCDETGGGLQEHGECLIRYRFSEDQLQIGGSVHPKISRDVRFILPLIDAGSELFVTRGSMACEPREFFNLNPGFMGTEFSVVPDGNGEFEMLISV